MTDQNPAQSKRATDEGTALNDKVHEILAKIVREIKSGARELTTDPSRKEKRNVWDILTRELGIKNCAPETIQRCRVLVKQHLLNLLQDAGFTGDVCEHCLDPVDMHESNDHTPSSPQDAKHEAGPEARLSSTNDLNLLESFHAKEREDFKSYCLKRASHHNTMGNIAIILGAIIIIVPFMIWSTVDSQSWHQFSQGMEENAYDWIDHIRALISARLTGTQYDPLQRQQQRAILAQSSLAADVQDFISVWKQLEESRTHRSMTLD